MIVIPAAGDGTRFRQAGYVGPKHLIDLGGKPMIQWVVENVRPLDSGPITLITQDSGGFYRPIAHNAAVGRTKGAIDTILSWVGGSEDYAPYAPLVVANCDQLIKTEGLEEYPFNVADGVIFTFRSANPAHSYVETAEGSSFILDIVEKPSVPPSDRAVSGVYWFNKACDFIEACKDVQFSTDGKEQYVSHAIAEMLSAGYNLHAVHAPTAILGTPEDFQRFETALELGGRRCEC